MLCRLTVSEIGLAVLNPTPGSGMLVRPLTELTVVLLKKPFSMSLYAYLDWDQTPLAPTSHAPFFQLAVITFVSSGASMSRQSGLLWNTLAPPRRPRLVVASL